jgi:hypothetical protein
MPTADQLPDELKDLAYRNALSLNHLDWDANVQKLVAAIRPKIGEPATPAHAPALVEFSSAFRSNDLNKLKKVLVIGIAALVIVAAAAAFYFTRGPKPGSALTVTLVRNPRLTDQTGPVDVSIDDHPSAQIRFDSSGSTPFQFQVPEGEHQIEIANPQTKASCSGTFSVNPKQTKFMLRMRDNGTACALDPAL